ncbi:unnamed protein product [Notodromas monacha]|uniref:Uncharacterized protein n=1 Tax=Notodromas monacha TaxID=399045 RepID=A0A7R9C0Q6_9CRUS|nr:unnamed protein product [Notodromas monacha]CAG0923641.1 unnamed protein product [Notodromas monacha]
MELHKYGLGKTSCQQKAVDFDIFVCQLPLMFSSSLLCVVVPYFLIVCVCVLFPVAPEEETVEFPREAGVLLGLRKFSNYSVTLAAVTRAGVGVKAEPLTCSTDEDVPAAVLTFGGIVSATAQSDTVLPCQHVGVPSPQVQWELPNGIRVTSSETPSNRLGIMPDGKLVIRDLARNDTGNYTCTASNDQGTDAVSHRLVVKCTVAIRAQVAPRVRHRHQHLGRLDPRGPGQLGNEKVRGELPENLRRSLGRELGWQTRQILAVNATSAVLNFKTWQSPECPIQRFKVQYKAAASNWDWILVGDSFGPDSYVPIRGLAPGTTYIISLTAFNPAGKTTLLHHFITKSLSGDSVRPAMPSSNEAVSSNDRGLLYQARFWLPLCTVLLALVSVVAGVTYCVRARRLHRLGMQLQLVHDDLNAKHGPAPGSGHHHLQVNRSDIRGSFSQGKVAKAEPQSPAYVPAHLGNLGTTNDDVYPYATYHEIMQHQSTDFNKLLSEAPPPPRCLIHPPEALKMSQMMVSPVPQGKLTNTYVTEAVAVAGNKRHGGNNKRHSRHQQQQQQQPRGRKRTSTNMPEEQLDDVLMEQDKMLFRRHSQPASESPSSDSSGPECLVDNESELSATLGRIQCSRPGSF